MSRLATLAGVVSVVTAACGAGNEPPAEQIVVRQALVIEPVGRYGRSAVHTDALEAAIVAGGYAYVSVEMPHERVMLLEAAGHSMVYVNGQPRAGDPYNTGFVRLPVPLKPGANDLLFRCSRGRLKIQLRAVHDPILLDTRDATTPDLRVGQAVADWAAVVVVNATAEPIGDLSLAVQPIQAIQPS